MFHKWEIYPITNDMYLTSQYVITKYYFNQISFNSLQIVAESQHETEVVTNITIPAVQMNKDYL